MIAQQQQQQQQIQSPAKQPPPVKAGSKQKAQSEEEVVVTWPLFKPPPLPRTSERFWERKFLKLGPKVTIRFQGVMLRLGKKKKIPKGYYFRLFSDGTLQYFKKEGDQTPKGQIQITFQHTAHLIEQKLKKDSLPVIQLEKFEGLHISIFDHKSTLTLQFFNVLKDFCIVSGFDKLYSQLEILGKGSFASVYKVKSIHNETVMAAKTYFKDTFETSQHKNKFVLMIKNEIMALRKVSHEGIIRLFEIIQEPERLILVMELVNGGDLYQLIKEHKKISEKNAAYMLKGCAEALHEMHINGFVHRDLKLENIMMKAKDSWDIKLVDFGFAEPINEKELVSKAGTPGYIPPEIFKLNPYTSKGDVFSIGVIFYSLVSGMSAFKGRNYQAVLEENRKCEIGFDRTVWKDVSGDCKQLLKKMLAPKPQHRISCAEILENDWIIEHTCPEKRQYSKDSMMFQKQMTKQKSMYNPSDGSELQFSCEFSYHTNDLKSFYQRVNSQKTFKTQKSNISVHSKMKQSQNLRSTSANRQQFVSMKSQTMKASQHHKVIPRVGSDGRPDSPEKKDKKLQAYKSEQASFGDVVDQDSDRVVAEDNHTLQTTMFEDVCIPTINIAFLKMSFNAFNRNKKPGRMTKKFNQ